MSAAAAHALDAGECGARIRVAVLAVPSTAAAEAAAMGVEGPWRTGLVAVLELELGSTDLDGISTRQLRGVKAARMALSAFQSCFI